MSELEIFFKDDHVYLLSDRSELGLKKDSPEGVVLLPPVNPRLGHKWEGFEVFPVEAGVKITLLKPLTEESEPAKYHRFVNEKWEPSDNAVYYTCSEIRQFLPKWIGAIQLQLLLLPTPTMPLPTVRQIKIGCHVLGDMLSYILGFALPGYLRQSIPLQRLVTPSQDGQTVVVPPAINFEKITNAQVVTLPDRKNIPVTGINTYALTLATPATGQAAYLIFDYVPAVKQINQQELAQITDVPAIYYQMQPSTDVMATKQRDRILLSESTMREILISSQENILINIRVIAQTLEDCRAIANKIIADIEMFGTLPVPAYDTFVFIGVNKRLKESVGGGEGSSPGNVSAGSLVSMEFTIIIWNIMQGITSRDISIA
ncbi:MAG: hypothetical protein WBB28_01620 [Crinalium sp.]